MDIFISAVKGPSFYIPEDNRRREFQLSGIDNIPCAYCGNKMISIKTLSKTFSPSLFQKDLFIDRAKTLENFLKPLQKKVLGYFSDMQKRNGFTSDQEILTAAKKECEQIVLTDLAYRFKKIKIFIENSSNKFLKIRLASTQDFYKKILRSKNYDELIRYIRSKGFLDIPPDTNDETSKKINTMIYGLKLSEGGSINGYILSKVDKLHPQKTYRDLFDASTATIEHMIPSSAGGKNKRFNYLSVCKKCNNDRRSKHLKFYLKDHPKSVENIERQLKLLKYLIPELIERRELDSKYRRYPEEVAKTLENLTFHYFDI